MNCEWMTPSCAQSRRMAARSLDARLRLDYAHEIRPCVTVQQHHHADNYQHSKSHCRYILSFISVRDSLSDRSPDMDERRNKKFKTDHNNITSQCAPLQEVLKRLQGVIFQFQNISKVCERRRLRDIKKDSSGEGGILYLQVKSSRPHIAKSNW